MEKKDLEIQAVSTVIGNYEAELSSIDEEIKLLDTLDINETCGNERAELVRKKSGVQMALIAFIQDCQDGKFREWNDFKIACGKILDFSRHGRPIPVRRNRYGRENPVLSSKYRSIPYNIALKMVKRSDNQSLCFKALYFPKGATIMEKVRIIVTANIPDEVKKDLLSVVDKP